LVGAATVALGYDFASVFVEGAGLRDGVDGLLDLGIGFEQDLEAFGSAVVGHEDFLLDLALDPVQIFGVLGFGVLDVVLVQVVLEFLQDFVVDFEGMSDRRTSAEVEAGEAADALFGREENVVAVELILELGGFGRIDDDVWGDAATTGDGAAGVRLTNLRRMLGNFALVVIFVERDE
jgi:hypothetical protein